MKMSKIPKSIDYTFWAVMGATYQPPSLPILHSEMNKVLQSPTILNLFKNTIQYRI